MEITLGHTYRWRATTDRILALEKTTRTPRVYLVLYL